MFVKVRLITMLRAHFNVHPSRALLLTLSVIANPGSRPGEHGRIQYQPLRSLNCFKMASCKQSASPHGRFIRKTYTKDKKRVFKRERLSM
jgi:hypothetical protein